MNPLTVNPAVALQHVRDTTSPTRPLPRRRSGRVDRAVIAARAARRNLPRAGG